MTSLPLRDLLRAMRPKQWTKNAVVMAAAFFAFWDRAQSITLLQVLTLAIPATLYFCLISSAVYVMNDLNDIAADRTHPVKRFRPIAAGRISRPVALGLLAVLLILGLGGGWWLAPAFGAVASVYLCLQCGYSFGLKHVALLDVFIIAGGFVLRAIAGAVVLQATFSSWLLLCTFLLALFLALCKRRHEKLAGEVRGEETRRSLAQYDARLLDMLIGITAAAAIVCYAIYTLAPITVEKFGTERLALTIPFVIFGIFRYLDLVYRRERGDRPEKILLTDAPILINLALYVLTIVLIFVLQRGVGLH